MKLYLLSPTITATLIVSVVAVTLVVVVLSESSSRFQSLLVAASSTVSSSQPCFFFIFGSGSFTTAPSDSSAKTRRTSRAFLMIPPPTHALSTSRSMNPYMSFKDQHNKIWSSNSNDNNKESAKNSKNPRGLLCTTTSTNSCSSKTSLYYHPLQWHFHEKNYHGGYYFIAGSQKNHQPKQQKDCTRLATTSTLSARSRSACFAVGITNQIERNNPQVNNDFQNSSFSWHSLQNNNDHASSSSSSRMMMSNHQSRTQYSNLAKQFQTQGIVYKTSILSMEEFRLIQQEMSSLPLKLVKETSSSVAHHRIGAQLPPDCNTVKILSNPNGTMSRVVNELVQGLVTGAGTSEYPSLLEDNKSETFESGSSPLRETSSSSSFSPFMKLSPMVPVEVRIYQQRGAGMELHYDDILFSPEQIEVVLTVENNSNCVTKWEEKTTTQQQLLPSQQQQQLQQQNGKEDTISMVELLREGEEEEEEEEEEERQAVIENKSAENKVVTTTTWKQVETEPNSAIILRAGPKGARHSVSSLKTGKRVILKFVFVTQDAVFLNDQQHHARQFNAAGKATTMNKKKYKKNSKTGKGRGEGVGKKSGMKK